MREFMANINLTLKDIFYMKKIASLFSLIAFTAVLAGCNTVAGIGKDVERGGEKVQNTAKDTQKKM